MFKPNVLSENLLIFSRWFMCTLHFEKYCCGAYSYNSILGILIVFTIVFLLILNNIIIYFLVPVSFRLWYLSFQSPLYSLFVLFSLSLSQIVFFLGTLPYHMGFQILNTLYYDYQMFWLISSLIMKWSRTCGPSPPCSQPDFWL